MAGRSIIIRHGKIKKIESGAIKVERLHNAQTGTYFKLKIKDQKSVTNSSIEELVMILENREFATGIVGAFSMKDAPTIASLRTHLPGFCVHFLCRCRRR